MDRATRDSRHKGLETQETRDKRESRHKGHDRLFLFFSLDFSPSFFRNTENIAVTILIYQRRRSESLRVWQIAES